MDKQIHYKAVIKMTSPRVRAEVQIPTGFDVVGGKFYISSIAGRLATADASKLVHLESTNLSNHNIYVTANGSSGVLGSCILSDVVSQHILENDSNAVGFPTPTQLYHCPVVELTLTDENHVLLTDLVFAEVVLILICPVE
jgi:hypothetical protein